MIRAIHHDPADGRAAALRLGFGAHVRRYRWLRVVAAAALCAVVGSHARAADIRVLCPGELRGAVLELAREFARQTRHRIEFQFVALSAVQKRVALGEQGDVVIGTASGIDALIKLGRAEPDSRTNLVAARIGIAVRSGSTTLPAVDTAEALRQSLLALTAIGYVDPAGGGSSGAQARRALEQLGIREELESRTRIVTTSAELFKRIAAGEVELGFAPLSEIATGKGVIAAGGLPPGLRQDLVYAAGLVRGVRSAEAARAFIQHLASPEARQRWRRAGFEAPD